VRDSADDRRRCKNALVALKTETRAIYEYARTSMKKSHVSLQILQTAELVKMATLKTIICAQSTNK